MRGRREGAGPAAQHLLCISSHRGVSTSPSRGRNWSSGSRDRTSELATHRPGFQLLLAEAATTGVPPAATHLLPVLFVGGTQGSAASPHPNLTRAPLLLPSTGPYAQVTGDGATVLSKKETRGVCSAYVMEILGMGVETQNYWNYPFNLLKKKKKCHIYEVQ